MNYELGRMGTEVDIT